MAAMYLVKFDDDDYELVHSADARNMTRAALGKALRKARRKAELKHHKINPKARAVSVRCVG